MHEVGRLRKVSIGAPASVNYDLFAEIYDWDMATNIGQADLGVYHAGLMGSYGPSWFIVARYRVSYGAGVLDSVS